MGNKTYLAAAGNRAEPLLRSERNFDQSELADYYPRDNHLIQGSQALIVKKWLFV
jgi:hypothetical protein